MEKSKEMDASTTEQLTNQNSRRQHSSKSTFTEIATEKGLVCVHAVVLVKLLFDLVSAVIGLHRVMVDNETCCGYELDPFQLPFPLGQIIAGPFIFLICLELLLLGRSVIVSQNDPQAPSDVASDDVDEEKARQTPKKSCCTRCLSYNGKALLHQVHLISLINPFFACFIAWMLLYQSDRTECLLVLGLEFGSIVLHFISVGLTTTVKSWKHFFLYCIQLIPFLASVALVLFYIKQEGVCYIVEQAIFHFQGCEICPDGFPPTNGTCTHVNGTTFAVREASLTDVNNWDSIGEIKRKTSNQGRFCGGTIEEDNIFRFDNGRWENTNFCFFPYK